MIKPMEHVRRWWSSEEATVSRESPTVSPPQAQPPWLHSLDRAGIPRALIYPSTTLARLLDQSADRFADAVALIYGDTRRTYRELLTEVNRAAGGLAGLGVRRGDRVLMVLPNCPEFVVLFFAVQKLGAVVVNVGPLMGADDLRAAIAMTAPRVAIGLDLRAPVLTEAARRSSLKSLIWVSLQGYQPVLKRLGYQLKLWQGHNGDSHHGNGHNGNGQHGNGHADHPEHLLLSDLLEHAPARPPTIEPDPRDIAVFQATGGTTGTLKLAELSHRSLLANTTQICTWMGCRMGQERILTVLPMFHVYGLTTCMMTGIYSASQLILATRFQAAQTLELLREHEPTLFPLVPAICEAISDLLEQQDPPRPLRGLRLCFSGAAPLPAPVAERFERLAGAKIIEGYGLTEASPVTHANLPGLARSRSIGLPMPDTRARIADLDDVHKDAPPGEPGELLVSGPQIMSGYFANPEQTDAALLRDEAGTTWLRTGDIARYDNDGYFYILDRLKDMIIRSGLKVYPGKVEKALLTHPAVIDVAVVGRPHPVHTETVVAVLVLNGGIPAEPGAITDELRALCRQHLAPYEVPEVFEFIEQLPRSALGKLLKRELRRPPNSPVCKAAPDKVAPDSNDNATHHPKPEAR